MREKPEDPNFFERAREKALAIVSEGSSDGYSVVLMAAPPKRIVPRPSEDAKKVVDRAIALRVKAGTMPDPDAQAVPER